MFEGGINFTKESDRVVRYVVLLVTPIFVLHGLLVMFGYFPSTNYVSDQITWIILGLWLAVGLYHFFAPITSKFDMAMRFFVYQALATAGLLFITGFLQPFTAALVLMFLAANLYFGFKGLIVSITSVVVACVIDMLIRGPSQPNVFAENLLGLAAILVLGAAIVAVVVSQETRRKTLLRSQQQERMQYDRILTIINNLTDATFSTDNKGKVLLYNAACLNLLDTNASLKGRSISELFELTDNTGTALKLQDLLKDANKTTRRDDIIHTFSDGEKIRLELTFAPIKSSFGVSKKHISQYGYIVIARDVTKEKSLEEERDEFISVVSHELRTPITIVEGTLSNLQVLMNQPKQPATSLIQSNVATAHEQVMYLAKMVNDLSTLSRAERGVADTSESIDVAEMVHRLHQQYQPDAEKKQLHLNLDLGTKLGTINVSRLYVEELLQNFITNAIKYTKEGSVTVIAKQAKGVVTFTVKDTGIGISRGDQSKIFNKFYRSEDYRIRETNGTGLGLYVSKKLASKIGTHIELTSRLNHGSSFSFSLPVENQ